ncbi:hypothetical protein NDA14_003039 [Ustilago hordei]|uniref:Uncharacterized protein n=1 Tax=Ustilago hordei TaxID=120017 RepID=I2G0C5_USTHO|nr:hypothetical protein NDA10_001130 [Ustilago hordei]KAJ1578823.1 hypothetical protein NDA15_000078 [Ustilago hordei]KAJ1580671.1 hypothetical protein NDA12_004203 [Ustilago hordei]KAJ1594937.1 hypothetical protein NDA14_003039 [Ustilago hordei]UTT91955.1 hypothetical protein NDA17_000443 [Ustilago hordei]
MLVKTLLPVFLCAVAAVVGGPVLGFRVCRWGGTAPLSLFVPAEAVLEKQCWRSSVGEAVLVGVEPNLDPPALPSQPDVGLVGRGGGVGFPTTPPALPLAAATVGFLGILGAQALLGLFCLALYADSDAPTPLPSPSPSPSPLHSATLLIATE